MSRTTAAACPRATRRRCSKRSRRTRKIARASASGCPSAAAASRPTTAFSGCATCPARVASSPSTCPGARFPPPRRPPPSRPPERKRGARSRGSRWIGPVLAVLVRQHLDEAVDAARADRRGERLAVGKHQAHAGDLDVVHLPARPAVGHLIVDAQRLGPRLSYEGTHHHL